MRSRTRAELRFNRCCHSFSAGLYSSWPTHQSFSSVMIETGHNKAKKKNRTIVTVREKVDFAFCNSTKAKICTNAHTAKTLAWCEKTKGSTSTVFFVIKKKTSTVFTLHHAMPCIFNKLLLIYIYNYTHSVRLFSWQQTLQFSSPQLIYMAIGARVGVENTQIFIRTCRFCFHSYSF